jgi:putative peptidoglycan lipid II flippase
LVLATVAINVLTCLALLLVLKRRMPAMTLIPWGMDAARLILAGALTGCIVWGLSTWVDWPLGWFGLLARVGIPSLLGLAFFGLLGSALGVAEVREIGMMLLRRMRLR